MKAELEIFRSSRSFIVDEIDKLSLDQLNEIPEGYTGNIIWHLGHLIVTHRGLVYQLGGHRSGMEKEWLMKYVRGSKPAGKADQAELDFIKKRLLEQVDEFETDLAADIFPEEYKELTTMTGFVIRNREEAIAFSNFHQATHMGYIMALRRAVS